MTLPKYLQVLKDNYDLTPGEVWRKAGYSEKEREYLMDLVRRRVKTSLNIGQNTLISWMAQRGLFDER
jgi:ubiquinone biosynthesis protein COQ9